MTLRPFLASLFFCAARFLQALRLGSAARSLHSADRCRLGVFRPLRRATRASPWTYRPLKRAALNFAWLDFHLVLGLAQISILPYSEVFSVTSRSSWVNSTTFGGGATGSGLGV